MIWLFEKDPDAKPKQIPIFPLNGVLLLPGGQLPLNVFEPRYLAMVENALKTERLIGIIQPQNHDDGLTADDAPLFETGCAGRITAFEETEDGRILITLTGLSRFKVKKELKLQNGYRRIVPDWSPYEKDTKPDQTYLNLDRERLKTLLNNYFSLQGMACDWEAIDKTPDHKLATCLAMICPLSSCEKQALLETWCDHERADKFMTMLEMAVRNGKGGCGGGCH